MNISSKKGETIILLQSAMRRAGHNPTDVEIVTIINKYENESGSIDLKVVIISTIIIT